MTDTELMLGDLKEILRLTQETHDAIVDIQTKVAEIAPEVKPMVDALAASPLIRAIGKLKK